MSEWDAVLMVSSWEKCLRIEIYTVNIIVVFSEPNKLDWEKKHRKGRIGKVVNV